MKPLVVLFVDHAPGLGGAEQSLLLLLKHLDRSHFSPHLACTGGPLAAAAAAQGVPVHRVSLPRLRRSPRVLPDWWAGARCLAVLADRLGVAVLHANTVRAAFFAAPAARMARRPLAWHMRDFWLSEAAPPRFWLDRAGKLILGAASARIIANSRAVAGGLPWPAKVVVVHNGVELAQPDPGAGEAFRREHGIPPGAPVAGMVGRLRPWKGPDVFLRVAARVAGDVAEARFVVVGGDPFGEGDEYPSQLRALAAGLGLAGKVTFTGQLPDVRPAMAALDLLVHPGQPEPFGLVNLEAMAASLPVVAFAHGALPEIVIAGETGLLVPPGDEPALAQAVAGLLRDAGLRAILGAAGCLRVASLFTAQRMADGVAQVLEAVAA